MKVFSSEETIFFCVGLKIPQSEPYVHNTSKRTGKHWQKSPRSTLMMFKLTWSEGKLNLSLNALMNGNLNPSMECPWSCGA